MSLENVIKEINLATESKANGVIQEGKNSAKELLQKTNEKIQKSREKTVVKTSEIISSMERTEIASLRLQLKKELLNAKKEIIDSVFGQAKKDLQNLPVKEKERILKKLLHNGKKEVEASHFYSNQKDKALVSKLSGLKFKEAIDCTGGFILENNDNTVSSDQTFDLILEKVKEKSISEISLRVFNE
ncbi:MAG: V-type ATP synthase subunit E family protein [archaeon]